MSNRAFSLTLSWAAVLTWLLFSVWGCAAAHRKPTAAGEITYFRNCRITEKNPDGTAASCYCGKFTLGTDAKTGKNVALCEGK